MRILRAPEPATLYRMHGNLTGAYDIAHVAVRNRVVVTNKTPTGLNRGFGGPQVYFPLERLMQRIAVELKLDSARRDQAQFGSRRRISLSHGNRRAAGFRRLPAALARGIGEGGLADLMQRRDAARAEGRIYGIGFAAVVEPMFPTWATSRRC